MPKVKLSVDDVYNNFCLAPVDFYNGLCHEGDKGYFGNCAEEVYKNMEARKMQTLDKFLHYSMSPYISEGVQYKMFYVSERRN